MTLFGELPAAVRPLRELPTSFASQNWRPPGELPSLAGCRQLGLDVETKDPQISDLGPGCRRPGNYICGISIALNLDGPRHYLPMRHEGGGNLDARLVLDWAREEFAKFSGDVVGANLLYDLDWLAQENVVLPRVRRFLDIQNAEPLIDENRLRFGLEYLSQDYLGETKDTPELAAAREAYRWKTDAQLKQNLWRLPAHLVGPYAEGDADKPLRILPLQIEKLKEEDLLQLFDLESRLIPPLLAMRRRGVRVDVERAIKLRQTLVKKRDEIVTEIRRTAGPKAELTIPSSLGPALVAAGLEVPRTAKTNEYSITKPLLERNVHIPLCKLIMDGRKLNTIINTFIDGHIKTHSINGRVHCEFHQLKKDEGGTIARFSSSSPNLQNIPKRDEELGPLMRGLFLPDEDEQWERNDLSQIEYRFLVHYARGPGSDEARARYRADPNLSFHKFAGELFGLKVLKGEQYDRLKNTNFCKVYGGGDRKLAYTFNSTFQEAVDFSRKYDRELPFVSATFQEAEQLAQRRGYVKTILKRRRRFPLWEPARYGETGARPLPYEEAKVAYGLPLRRAGARNALNGMLQGGAADFLKKAMVDQYEAGIYDVLGAPLVTVHDELGWSVPTTVVGTEAADESRRILEKAIRLRVPVYAAAGRGKSWGECT